MGKMKETTFIYVLYVIRDVTMMLLCTKEYNFVPA